MTTRYFDLQGAALAVSAEDADLVTRYSRIFEERHHPDPPASVAFALTLEVGTPEPIPEAATVLADGAVLDEGRCIAVESGGDMLQIFPEKASLRLYGDGARARIVVAEGERDRVRMNPGMIALEAALRHSGQLPMHAAGLTLEDGRIVLVIGRSGAGKTTTALALCGGGMGLCSDDLMICRLTDEGVTAWGVPRSLKVHRHSATLLPWAAPLLSGEWSAEDERPLRLAQLREVVRVEDQRPRPVAAICVLERRGDARSRVEPMAKAELLTVAAVDHVRTSTQGVLPAHADRLATLARLVRTLPTYRMLAGADPTDLAPRLREALPSPAEAT